ncbi:MAG: type II toxin-antitoxin system YafQ family toxin [Alphaproteobacteria bacterium]|nr:type II toxin-antitoxin system YafQ family toxin [Alphaproteobacteria bacterium]
MLLLIGNDAPLGPEWWDHPLKGEWSGTRECHVGGDFLLIYQTGEMPAPGGSIVFIRAGTHSELFQE